MFTVNASELEEQFHIEIENLKNGLNTILDAGPLACVSLFGGHVSNYTGSKRNDFLYRSLSQFTLGKWNEFANHLNLSSVLAEDTLRNYKALYLNAEDVKPFAKETIEDSLKLAFNEPRELVKERLTKFLMNVSTSEDFSFANTGMTYKGYFSVDRNPKGYADLKSFLVDVKKAIDLDVDMIKANKDLLSLDVINRPKVDLFNSQIKVKSFKSGKVTVKLDRNIAKNLDSFLGI